MKESLKFLMKFYLSVTKDKTLLTTCLRNQEISPLSVDIQEEILKMTVKNPHIRKYKPPTSYQRFFLRVLIDSIESYGSELSDNLVEQYANVISQSSDDDCVYRTYIMRNDSEVITLKESSCFVANSTTGLQTWEAAKYLLEWCLENASLFKNKRLLELGSGIGLLGISITKLCQPQKFIFTDKSWDVLNVLSENIEINLEENTKKNVEKHQLLWGSLSPKDTKQFMADYILGADVVFDPSIIPDLVATIEIFLRHGETKCAFIASTIRNVDTDEFFTAQLGLVDLKYEILDFTKNDMFIYDSLSKFKLYKIFLR